MQILEAELIQDFNFSIKKWLDLDVVPVSEIRKFSIQTILKLQSKTSKGISEMF